VVRHRLTGVEQLKDAATLTSNGITRVTKNLVADLMTDLTIYFIKLKQPLW
jgi:hypothetical protein